MIPFPKEEATPPVTNTYLQECIEEMLLSIRDPGFVFYMHPWGVKLSKYLPGFILALNKIDNLFKNPDFIAYRAHW
jgi:hypothetical protein